MSNLERLLKLKQLKKKTPPVVADKQLVALFKPIIERIKTESIPTEQELLDIIRPLIPEAIPGKEGHTPTDEEIIALIKPLVADLKKEVQPTTEQIVALIKPLIPKPVKGDKGDPGKNGTTPSKKDLKEIIKPLIPRPVKGEKGDKPDHKWEDTKLMFEKPNGEWGKAVDLKGPIGDTVKTEITRLGGSVSGGKTTIKEDGTTVATAASFLNFGTGITATANGSGVDVTVNEPDLSDYVVGPASATNNAFAIFDTTTGKLIQNSPFKYSSTGGSWIEANNDHTDSPDGDIGIRSTVASDGAGGYVSIAAANATASAPFGGYGGGVYIDAGSAYSNGYGGEIYITGGFGGTTGTGGNVELNAGIGGTSSGDGGTAFVKGGPSFNGDGGSVSLIGGNGTTPGDVWVKSGNSNGYAILSTSLLTSVARTYNFPNTSGTLALTSNLSSYVPYTGATTNVTLGSYTLTANNLTSDYDLMAGLSDTSTIATSASGTATPTAYGNHSLGSGDFTYRVYAYRTINSQKIFSPTPLEITYDDPYLNAPPHNVYYSEVSGTGRTYMSYGQYHYLDVYAYKNIGGTDYICAYNYTAFYDGAYPPSGTYDIQWSWDSVPGCDGYYAILNDPSIGAYGNVHKHLVGEGNNSFIDSGLSSYPLTGTPNLTSIPTANINVSWNAVSGADGYFIYLNTPTNAYYVQYVDQAGTSFTDDNNLTLLVGDESQITLDTAYSAVHDMYGRLRTNDINFYGTPYLYGNGTLYMSFANNNSLIGEAAGDSLTETSFNNTIFGKNAGTALTAGNTTNTIIGVGAMRQTTTNASGHVAIGYDALNRMGASTVSNVGIGAYAGNTFTTGNNNLFLGYNSGPASGASTSANSNVSMGQGALRNLTSGSTNVGIGEQALYEMTASSYNFALGYASLRYLTGGNYNLAMGYTAGYTFTSASYTTSIGFQANFLCNSTDSRGIYYPTKTGEYKTAIGPNSISQMSRNLVLGGPQNTNFVANVGLGHSAPVYGLSVGSGDVLIANNTLADLGAQKITNGDFGAGTNWTLGTGWTIAGGLLLKNANGTGTASQTSANMTTPLVVGEIYELNFQVTAASSGSFNVSCAGVNFTANNSIDTVSRYTFVFKALTTDALIFAPILSADRYTIDNVSLRKVTKGDVNVAGRVTHQGAFAEIYVADNVTAQSIPTGATYTKLTAFATNGQSSNCTADASNDKITITKGGKYLVTGMIDAAIGTANTRLDLAVFAGGTIQPNIKSYVEFPNANVDQEITITGILNVSANTDIDLRVKHDDGGSVNVTPENASLVATYLGE